MLRIGTISIVIAGVYACIMAFSKSSSPCSANYKFSSFKASHGCDGKVETSDDYHLQLLFGQDLTSPEKTVRKFKEKNITLKCINPISDIKIFSTEKINETSPAGKDISGLFTFRYIRNLETKYGTMIKEGIEIPVSEFENLVDQDNSADQLKQLNLRLVQKPILESELQFIIQVSFENGEVMSDTTECIAFEGVKMGS
jgi:hypothetical protein